MRVPWLADVLRAAGLHVVEHVGWEARGNDEFAEIHAVVWHHDGSPPGASPNVPAYIIGQTEAGKPGANCWVGLDGTWHILAGRMTYHAGKVLPGKPDNHHSIGVETDHTTGETWAGVELLAALRKGTAAILTHLGIGPATGLEFHKTICAPPGRKLDPDGLHLADEQAAVARLMAPVPHPTPHPSQEDDVPAASDVVAALATPSGKGRWLLTYDGGVRTEGDAKFYGSVPGLPAQDRQGVGGFYVIEPFSGGYALTDTKGNSYRFGAK